PYSTGEVEYAYCYRCYFRWRTHRGKASSLLPHIVKEELSRIAKELGIRILECASDQTDLLLLVSLRPDERISGCASKRKGRLSKCLREGLRLTSPADLLSRGYFACTVGKSTRARVERYLSSQGDHHGYSQRIQSPTLVKSFQLSDVEIKRVSPAH